MQWYCLIHSFTDTGAEEWGTHKEACWYMHIEKKPFKIFTEKTQNVQNGRVSKCSQKCPKTSSRKRRRKGGRKRKKRRGGENRLKGKKKKIKALPKERKVGKKKEKNKAKGVRSIYPPVLGQKDLQLISALQSADTLKTVLFTTKVTNLHSLFPQCK